MLKSSDTSLHIAIQNELRRVSNSRRLSRKTSCAYDAQNVQERLTDRHAELYTSTRSGRKRQITRWIATNQDKVTSTNRSNATAICTFCRQPIDQLCREYGSLRSVAIEDCMPVRRQQLLTNGASCCSWRIVRRLYMRSTSRLSTFVADTFITCITECTHLPLCIAADSW